MQILNVTELITQKYEDNNHVLNKKKKLVSKIWNLH
jgi:hypothetical protein